LTILTETAQKVLEQRYFLEGETKWEHLVERVSSFFATTKEEYEDFYGMLLRMDYLPNSPTLMNAGTDIKSFSACFVLPVEDSIESIFKYYKDAALISKSGGGVGANFSNIRPHGSKVGSTNGVASGSLSFMKGQNALTEIIKQGGRRRGANMMMLDVDHPEVWEFISCKDEPGVMENANLSVRISDSFMDKVSNKTEVPLWDEICRRAWSSAEPGVVFGDTIQGYNNVPHLGDIVATNPCGEQPLLPYESCSLIAINLSNHYDSEHDSVDWAKLAETTSSAVLFMNRVLDKSEYAIPECQEAMYKTRKIGVGIMGLHDLLIQLKYPYDSEGARGIASHVMEAIADEASDMSEKLGRIEGNYSAYNDKCLTPPRRNANLTTIAPTGTLSMIADCSGGCEPYYAPVTFKTVLDGTEFCMPNKWLSEEVKELIMSGSHWDEATNLEERELFKGSQDIHWKDHILMQATLQKHVDSSISKTINMNKEATIQDVKDAYMLAWSSGCKGITIYRDGSREAQVLSKESGTRKETQPTIPETSSGFDERECGEDFPTPLKLVLDEELEATRYRLRDGDGHKVYFTVCTQDDKPVEVFSTLPSEMQNSLWGTISRLLSLALRYNIPLDDVTKQLRKSSNSVSDIPAKVARVLDKYKEDTTSPFGRCPECESSLIFESGCNRCPECGWSKCI